MAAARSILADKIRDSWVDSEDPNGQETRKVMWAPCLVVPPQEGSSGKNMTALSVKRVERLPPPAPPPPKMDIGEIEDKLLDNLLFYHSPVPAAQNRPWQRVLLLQQPSSHEPDTKTENLRLEHVGHGGSRLNGSKRTLIGWSHPPTRTLQNVSGRTRTGTTTCERRTSRRPI